MNARSSDDLSARLLQRHLKVLCTDIGSRMIGTKGDYDAAEYVETVFTQHGLTVESQRMPCYGWDLLSTSLRVDGRRFRAIGNMYSPAGKAEGILVLSEPDIPDGDFSLLKGKAVAVYGDFAPFLTRLNAFAMKAERAGVAFLIVIDTYHSTSATKLVGELGLKRMPVMSVGLETGLWLAKLAGRRAECTVKADKYRSQTRDVIGILWGRPREICIEAHRDTGPDTPGADDNGSGTVVLLELSRLLADAPRKRTMRFVSATGEEFGNVGTPVHAKKFAKELKKIDLMINADCVAGLLCPPRVYVRKGDAIGALVEKMVAPYRSMRLVRTDKPYGGHISEYLGGRAHEVNVISDWTNALIHTPKDVPANLSPAKLAEVAHFLRDLILAYDAKGA